MFSFNSMFAIPTSTCTMPTSARAFIGIHKWHADPEHVDAGRELAHFGRTEFEADHEGIAIYARLDRTGYILCTDQIDGNSHYHIYSREGGAAGPHDHAKMIKCVRGGADATDGLEVSSAALGWQFPHGIVVAMNSGPKNFLVYWWEDFACAGQPALRLAKMGVDRLRIKPQASDMPEPRKAHSADLGAGLCRFRSLTTSRKRVVEFLVRNTIGS